VDVARTATIFNQIAIIQRPSLLLLLLLLLLLEEICSDVTE